ncbi:hypothetical protein TrVGV298_006443 [Trichoderma virens]|nr:hypothetical protein TrVGV298_006443 [Trichoderma virens]
MVSQSSGKAIEHIGTRDANGTSKHREKFTHNETPEDDIQPIRDSESSYRAVLQSRKPKDASNCLPTNPIDAQGTKLGNAQDPYGHLPPHQADILKRQIVIPEGDHGIKAIYRYATRNDAIIIIVSSLFAIASGAAMPLMNIVFGRLQNTFQGYSNGTDGGQTLKHGDFTNQMTKFVLYFVYLAVGQFVASFVCTVGFIYTGEHITAKIRERYLASCLRQNIGFFDKTGTGEVTTRITAETNLIQDGISEKVSLTIAAIATFITAFVVGFITYWKLTLILSCALFALLLSTSIGSRFVLTNNKISLESYAQGGSLAEEVIGSIRNTIAFGTQDRLSKKYSTYLDKGAIYGYKMQISMACMSAMMWLILYLTYALAFWQGSKYVVDEVIPVSKLLIVVFSIINGSFSLVNVLPYVQAFTTAIAAMGNIANTINRLSPLDVTNNEGKTLDYVDGNLYLENIQHIYPSRPEILVMDNVTLEIPAGKITALVGASGSGKSTIFGLIERFYEPISGVIYLDGYDISQLNLRWLRQQVALVNQDPTLFSTSIYHNIRYGLIGTKFEYESEIKQRELIIEAAKKANAHDFVTGLPQGYETKVGEKGFLLSGGQKQRIAIARAIVSDPKILLLDEATSALDTKSESAVQIALKAAAEGRTTICIAHRLSTIKGAHNIVVMSQGRVVEQGTHDHLLNKKGPYYDLVMAQSISKADDVTEDGEESLNEKEEQLIRTFLSTETTHVAGLSGVTLGTLISMTSTLLIGIVMSVAIGWKLSLVCLSTMPALLACGWYRFWILAQFQQRSISAYASSASIASEAISSIRTVAALTREHEVLHEYREALMAQQHRSLISVLKSSVLFAASQSLIFLCLALGFWYGGTLIGKGEYDQFQFFLCLPAVIFGSQSAGTIFSFAPNMSNAHRAATELKRLFDRQPTIDTWSCRGERLGTIEGEIEFRQVYFRYPERLEQSVLRGLSIFIRPGQYIALVGSSGCGKSTAISLLERFYDPLAGEIYVDGRDISTLNITDYRSFISLVSQEPTLYQGTIKDNITLGSPSGDVSDEAIEFACREANIYDFIVSLPDGFNTIVGSKGALLSGGQKQRIAIARALIRDPKILLLDEATSALDSESEQIVQAALDKAAKGRTTIAVAHRLSTIQKADRIYVFDMGKIVEEGTHADLMKKRGRYAELVNLQSLAGDA